MRPKLTRRRLMVGGGLGAGLLSGGVFTASSFQSGRNHEGPDAPQQVPWSLGAGVAWVFSSGGPRGYVHVGVIKALDELGLHPGLIVGASAGALVGTMRAAGYRGTELQSLALEAAPWKVTRLNPFGPPWLAGDALADFMRHCVDGRPLEALPTPVACVAWNRSQQQLVAFNRGDTGLAVQASSAIEGDFAPVTIRGEVYVDADLHQPMPVRTARALGGLRVLAVDASAHEDRAPAGTEPWRAGDLRKRALTQPDANAADLVLHPDTGYYAGMSREYRERVIEIGYRETLKQADALRALHGVDAKS
ncbi:patatin-like phospholipase family protein [Hydrogenophaga sp. 5NK40-0174]|uniref:patatin-like phospholipase family protein n=1 Tax=Hydrogenophaga sp. 5NK40-0174 TaxID=3127649 RepID=UPI00310BD525